MFFHEKLNQFIEEIDCTAKDISNISGISAPTLSRYRSGTRTPDIDSDNFDRLCTAISTISKKNPSRILSKSEIKKQFTDCTDIIYVDKNALMDNFNTIVTLFNININDLCKHINYDPSTISKFRTGARQPSSPTKLADSMAVYIANTKQSIEEIIAITELIGCTMEQYSNHYNQIHLIRNWLLTRHSGKADCISQFLNKLDEFDLNEYIKAIHFDELKVPTVPFQLPTSKYYYGLEQMMESELNFLKTTVLSKSMEPVILYSDMPMEEMAKDKEFPKKWMFGMAMMIKKGLHLHQVHNIDRPLPEMMLGLEGWIPMYMTGQITPYYVKGIQNQTFLHFLRVSGAAALSGEAITGHHAEGRYYLSKTKEDISYYRKRGEALLKEASPLMDIYREDDAAKLKAFLSNSRGYNADCTHILSAPPIYTMDSNYLTGFLDRHNIPETDKGKIIDYAKSERQYLEKFLTDNFITDEIAIVSKEEFEQFPLTLSLSRIFYEKDITYTYEDYLAHLEQTKEFEKTHHGYNVKGTTSQTFRNLQITIMKNRWVMLSKNKAPAIHFVIHNPKLYKAIANFYPPIVE